MLFQSTGCYFSRRAPGRKIIASDFAPRVLALRARAPSRRAPGLKIIASDFEPRVLALRARALQSTGPWSQNQKSGDF